MDNSTILILLALGAGAGLAFLLMGRHEIVQDGGGVNIVGGFGNTYNLPIPGPAIIQKEQIQFPKRLPHINNGDTANNLTSYIPGGY